MQPLNPWRAKQAKLHGMNFVSSASLVFKSE